MTTEMLGIFSIASSFFGVLTTIVCSGISITIARFVSINHDHGNYRKNDSIISSSLVVTITLSIILGLAVIVGKNIFVKILSDIDCYLLLICSIPALIICGFYTPFKSYLLGREKYFESSLVELVEQILRIIVCFIIFVFCKQLSVLYAPIVALNIAALLSTILGIFYYFKCGGRLSKRNLQFKPLISKSTPITIVKMLSTLLMPVVTIILPLRLVAAGMTSEMALSELGIASGMTLPLLSIPGTIIGSLAVALIPQITTLYENKENNTIVRQIKSSYIFTIIVTMICIPPFITLGENICMFIFNNEYAGILLAKASWVMLPMGISQLSSTILNSMGYEKKTFKYYLISSIFLLLGVWILPKYIGVESVIWALGISSLVVAILNTYKINSLIGYKLNILKPLIISILIALPITLLSIYIKNIFSIFTNNIFVIIISSIISIVCYLSLLIAFGVVKLELIKEKLYSFRIFKKKNI